jgi:hypothetical protein
MKKGYCNISSTTTAISEKRLLQQIHYDIGENLLQQRKKAIATSQALLLQHHKTPIATTTKNIIATF